jgi:hypothetical protein
MIFLLPIKGNDETVKKLHKTDDKHTSTCSNNKMQQQKTKSNLTSIIHRNDAQPWDCFVINTDNSMIENDMK